jgi:hypothetical protein
VLTIALLITVPLLARFLVASRMEVLRKQLLTSDGEYTQLKARHEHLVEDLRQARNQKRQCELRASFVAQDWRVETQILRQLREHAAPAPVRRAA